MDRKTKILIVEDEMIIAANISLQLTTLGYSVVGIIPRPEEALPKIRETSPDILLLDINLNGSIDGIELAHQIHKEYNIPIIYLTANADDAHFQKAKETNPYAFISKPFKKIDLQRAIELTLIRIEEETSTKKVTDEESYQTFVLSEAIFVRSHDRMIKVAVNDILYIQAERNYCKIHCENKEHLLVSTLKDFEEKLTVSNLIRVHRSYIVNMHHIDEIGANHVVIAKKTIPISADLKKQLLLHIQKI